MWSVLLCSFIHIQFFVPHVEPNTKMVVKKCNFIDKVPEVIVFRVVVFLLVFYFIIIIIFFYHNIAYFNFCPKSLKRSFTTNFSPASPRLKQLQQSLSVSLSSRTEHWDRFVTYCKRYSLYSGQWQHFCSFVGSFCRYWPPNSLPPELCFFCIQSTALQWFQSHPLRQLYQSASVSNSVFVTITAHVQRASGLSTGAHSLRPAHYASLSCIIANHSGNHQLFAARWRTASKIRSSQWSDQPRQRTLCMHRRHENMDDGKSAQTERRQNRSSFRFSSFLKPSTVSLPDSIIFGSRNIPFSDSARNRGFVLDSKPPMKKHVIKICQTVYFELKRIRQKYI